MNIFPKKYHPKDELPSIEKSKSLFEKQSNNGKKSFNPLTDVPQALGGTINTPNFTYRVLSKMAYGPSRADIEHIETLPGATESDRIIAYIDEQLNPLSIADTSTDSMLTNGFETLNKTHQEFFQQHNHFPEGGEIPWDTHIQPGREISYAVFIRAINSKRQLQEVLADFWHNHFNVYLEGDNIQPMFGHYDRDVIRPNLLGNFREMVYQVTRSNCMLSYLNNGQNEQSEPNENFARELLELHTISAKNYYGHMEWQDVPTDSEGRRIGYVEEDVRELARALTGWSFSGANWRDYQYLYEEPIDVSQAPTGLFMFRPDWHDEGSKRIMGNTFEFDANDPEKDVNDILDMLAEHPATAAFLAFKLCRRFIADEPPENIVSEVAQILHQNWQAPDQIKLAMEVLLKSPEFLNTWGEKIKRPFEKTIAAMRQIEYSFPFDPRMTHSGWHYWNFRNSGQPPFSWTSPNGYPDTKSHWLSASSNMFTWKYIQWICRFRQNNDDQQPAWNNILSITAEGIPDPVDRTANNLVTFWYQKICGHLPENNSFEKLAEFMSYDDVSLDTPVGTDRDAVIDIFDNQWPDYNSERLYAVVSTILLTAEYSYR